MPIITHHIAAFAFASAVLATPALADAQAWPAQGRRQPNVAQRIPQGQLPPPGLCRVWYDGRSPGRQPAPTDCRTAERIAARDRNAQVVYGAPRGARAIPRNAPYPGQYPNPSNRPGAYGSAAPGYQRGFQDGYEKGLEDVRDDDRFDPARHGWYRSADRGYDRRFESKDDYKDSYREGFTAGYAQAYRQFPQTRRY